MNLWMALGLSAGLFCIARGVMDLRQGRYVWGALGIAVGLALLLTPIQTHPGKYDLPAPTRSG
jgi:hypothetical protein